METGVNSLKMAIVNKLKRMKEKFKYHKNSKNVKIEKKNQSRTVEKLWKNGYNIFLA